MNSRILRAALCFLIIATLIACEATLSFATEGTGDLGANATKETVDDTAVVGVKYLSHEFKSGNEYVYTGSNIEPELVKLTVEVTKKIGTSEETISENVSVTNFSEANVRYRNNKAIGTGYVIANIEGKDIEIPFSIVFGKITSFKIIPASYKSIKLSWNKVAGSSGYIVYRSTSAKGTYKAISTIKSADSLSFTNTNLALGKTYYYKVRPYRYVNGAKVYGEYSSCLSQRVQPATAVISSVKRASYNSLKVNWKKVSGATGYIVYRSTTPNGKYSKVASIKGYDKVSYIDKKRSCGVYYYYKVKAYRKYNGKLYYGNASAYKSGRTTPATTVFNSKSMAYSTSASLCWNKSLGASGYEIYMKASNESAYSCAKIITSGNTTKWTDKGLDKNLKYYYKIRPYKTVSGTKVYGGFSKVYTKDIISDRMASLMIKYIDKPYKYGGNTPKGWDCSGFVQWATKYLFGKDIPRTGGAQARGGKYVNKKDMSSWKPGDVLVYKRNGGGVSHVGLYIGGGKMMHALNSRYDTVIQDVSYYEKWDRGNYLSGVRRYSN